MNSPFRIFIVALVLICCVSCATTPKIPAPVAVKVEGLNVFAGEFQGRMEAYADISGYLSSAASQLIEPPRQWRQGYRLYVELEEQPAIPTEGPVAISPFQTRISIDIAGLVPGVYLVNVNGKEEHLEIDGAGLRPAQDRGQLL